MRPNRHTVGALAATVAVLVGAGAALAAAPGTSDRSSRCDARVARIAERRGVTVEQLTADVKARLLARIDAAEKARRISSERGAKLRERIAEGSLCGARNHVQARLALRGMLGSAARFLGLDRVELREQLPGTSLAALAEKQGKNVSALEEAMVAPARQRLAKAVAGGGITQARADALLERLQSAADRLAKHVFPTT
jgi:hypothetical protein